jgi:hypothetical protein
LVSDGHSRVNGPCRAAVQDVRQPGDGIALWLGHENSETTHQYVEADLEIKRHALDRIAEPPIKNERRKKVDGLLDFLDGL